MPTQNLQVILRELDSSAECFSEQLDDLVSWPDHDEKSVQQTVEEILRAVKREGDQAVLRYTQRFDSLDVQSVTELEISKARQQRCLDAIDTLDREALQEAAIRVRRFHEKQLQPSWSYEEDNGTVLGQQVTALDRVGIYVPGGKASYPSSVLMNAIPAKVAGVEETIMVVPSPNGELSDLVVAAAMIAGVDRIFTLGGAQAVAALAFGTETIPAVDKIVGPGNVYVAEAKRQVFGQVGIDMVAGPSEILILCDGKTDPDWIAMDLFSQAEHDEFAQSILISPDAEFLQAVNQSIQRLITDMPRCEIIKKSLEGRGGLIKVRDLDEGIDLVNKIAPEHFELSVDQPEQYLPKIKHAGAIFMGRYSAEALGDYCAGPNHVLPTSGTARFSSPLGVYDFQKKSSIIYCSKEGASQLGKIAQRLAVGEGFDAHAQSAAYRINKK